MNKFTMLFGFMLGDGWIDINYQGGFSGDIDALEIAKNDLISLYGNIGKAKIRTEETSSPKYNIKGTTSQFVISRAISKKFVLAGMPKGKRVEQLYSLPNWILNGSRDIKISFISGLYAAEGFSPTINKGGCSKGKIFKPLGFLLTKRKVLEDDFRYFMLKQIGDILTELGIQYVPKIRYTHTCADNIEIRFDFKNNIANTLYVTSLLDMRYCPRKKERFELAHSYYYRTRIRKEFNRPIPTFEDYCVHYI